MSRNVPAPAERSLAIEDIRRLATTTRLPHLVLVLGLAGYAFAFVAFLVAKPFGADDLRFIAISDIAGAVPPLVAGAIGVIAARRSSTDRQRRGWTLLALGWLCWGAGESTWAVYEVILRIETPFPSLVDVGYLSMIPLVFAGIVHLMPRGTDEHHYGGLLDASVITLVAAGLIWHFVLIDTVRQSDVGLLQKVLSAAYPLSDLLLLSVVALSLQRVWRGGAGVILAVLFGGLLSFLTADLVFAYLDLNDRYASGNLVTDPAWVFAFLLMVYAAGLQALWQPPYRSVLPDPAQARWLRTVPFAVLAIATALLVGDAFTTGDGVGFDGALTVVAVAGALAVAGRVGLGLAANLRVVRQTRHELSRAADFQSMMLPPSRHSAEGYHLAARYLPARNIGGDFYDWWEDPPGTLHIAFGDVMGKGMAAALLMASMRTALRAASPAAGPGAVVSKAAALMDADFANTAAFSTLFYAEYDTSSQVLRYVDCGHGLAFVVSADGRLVRLKAMNFPLGTMEVSAAVDSAYVSLGSGDRVFVCSDGLLDLVPEILGPRFLASLLSAEDLSGAELLDRTISTALNQGTPEDDVTLLLLQVDGDGRASTTQLASPGVGAS